MRYRYPRLPAMVRRRAMRALVAALFAAAACTPARQAAPPDIAAPSPATAPASAPPKTASAASPAMPAPPRAPAREEPAPESAPPAASAPAPKAPAAATKPPTTAQKPPARTAPPKSPPAAAAKAPAPASPPAAVATAPATAPAPRAAPLDIKTLEQRLRETNAIGVMTKLSLKNQVDDLLEKFREYHRGQLKVALAELRHPYELLLMKVLSLLQDGDAALAQAINASRDAIWAVLADRDKFFQYTS